MDLESKMSEIDDGVHAFVQADGTWGINNTGVVTGADETIFVDSCMTESRTRSLLTAARTVTGGSTRALVNTHSHLDHTNGNSVIGAPLIIGHTRCRSSVNTTALPSRVVFPGVEWGNLEVPTPPNLTFDDRLVLHLGERQVELIHLGTPAHTDNDIVVWLPVERVLFSGDLVFNHVTPFVLFGSVEGSLETLGAIRRLDPRVIVPGHGPVGDATAIDFMERYLRFVAGVAAEAHAAGIDAFAAAQQTDLGEFGDLPDSERIVGNLYRAIIEVEGTERGSPVPVDLVFAGMQSYLGHPLRCLA